jgi:hypothetical protein
VSAGWSKEGGQNDAFYGYSVASAGDVNGDGYADVVIGAPSQTDSVSDEGTARVYAGSSTGLGSSYIWFDAGGQTLSWYGRSVASAGDVNGDGCAEVLVGAPQYNGALTNEGLVSLYYGNGGPGVSIRPEQSTLDLDPLSILGRTTSTTGFSIGLYHKNPFGMTGYRHEYEVRLLGELLDGSETTKLTHFSYAHAAGTAVFVRNLLPGHWYHWRVRWLYDPTTMPFMPASRWMTVPWNGWNEADFRTDEILLYLPTIRK